MALFGKSDKGAQLYREGKAAYDYENYEEAVELLDKAAKLGNADAQYYLGRCCESGLGMDEDLYEAVHWYEEAAEQGHADAQYNLALCYKTGAWTQDHKKAFYWFSKAAEQGHANAQDCLGECYDKGEGVKQDWKKALYWYEKAVEQGRRLYREGMAIYDDMTKDREEAVELFRKGAALGSADAMYMLGRCCEEGDGGL